MKKKYMIGILLGAAAGVFDLLPMILQKLTWDANLSAFSMWVVVGFLVSATDLKIKGAFKGLLVSFLVLIPSAIIIGSKEPLSLIPITAMTLILGSLLGYFQEKLSKS